VEVRARRLVLFNKAEKENMSAGLSQLVEAMIALGQRRI
jgi:hypothetical protein